MISIITPVFNAEKYLRKCIESVLCQTYDNWEMILVDDGSTDHSNDILNEYAQKDSRIRVVTQKNSGPSVARNVALDMARGDYVTFLDSDDWFEPETLSVAWNVVVETATDMVVWNFKRFKNGRIVKTNLPQPMKGLHGKDETKAFALDFLYNLTGSQYMPCCWIRMIRTDVLRTNNICFNPRLKRTEDYALLVKTHLCIENFYGLPDQELTVYRTTDDSITHSYVDNYMDMVDMIVEDFKADTHALQYSGFEYRLANMYLYRTYVALEQEFKRNQAKISYKYNNVREILSRENLREYIQQISIKDGRKRFGNGFILMKLRFSKLLFAYYYFTMR